MILPMSNRLQWLTPRERLVLSHLMNGLSAEEIAQREYLGLATVRTYIRNILLKLNVNTQLQAVAYTWSACWPAGMCQQTAVAATLGLPA
jgi:two-component system, NarL family, nitrate/nitrite response regulator NarL